MTPWKSRAHPSRSNAAEGAGRRCSQQQQRRWRRAGAILKADGEGKNKAQRLIHQIRKNPSKVRRFTAQEVDQIVGWC